MRRLGGSGLIGGAGHALAHSTTGSARVVGGVCGLSHRWPAHEGGRTQRSLWPDPGVRLDPLPDGGGSSLGRAGRLAFADEAAAPAVSGIAGYRHSPGGRRAGPLSLVARRTGGAVSLKIAEFVRARLGWRRDHVPGHLDFSTPSF